MSKIEIEAEELQRIQSESTRLAEQVKTLTTERASLAAERDALAPFKARAEQVAAELGSVKSQYESVVKERDEFKTKVPELEGNVLKLTNESRERALLDEMVILAPTADRKVLRGLVVEAAEKRQLDRYPEDPKVAAKAAIDKFKTEAPTVFSGRSVTAGGAPTGNNDEKPKRTHVL